MENTHLGALTPLELWGRSQGTSHLIMLVGFPLGERLSVRIPPLRPCWKGRGWPTSSFAYGTQRTRPPQLDARFSPPLWDARGTSPADAVLFMFTFVDKCQQPQSEARNDEVFHALGWMEKERTGNKKILFLGDRSPASQKKIYSQNEYRTSHNRNPCCKIVVNFAQNNPKL